MNKPLVSLIVTSYKHADYIDDCIKSILAQTYFNMEILYLDDASGDGTFEKAQSYKEALEKKYEKVTYILNKKNNGVIKNLNRLVRMSRGKYVKFLAADDFMLFDGIEKLVSFMENHTEYDMAYSNGLLGTEETHFPMRSNVETQIYEAIPPSGGDLFDLLYEKDFISAPTVIIKRSIYDRVGLYDEDIGIEDWDYFLRVAKEGIIGYLAQSTMMYRIVDSSMSHSAAPSKRINMKRSELQILEKHKGYASQAAERMKRSLDEALQDAYHIDDANYIAYLYAYAKRNHITISTRNRLKGILYRLGIIRWIEQKSCHTSMGIR